MRSGRGGRGRESAWEVYLDVFVAGGFGFIILFFELVVLFVE